MPKKGKNQDKDNLDESKLPDCTIERTKRAAIRKIAEGDIKSMQGILQQRTPEDKMQAHVLSSKLEKHATNLKELDNQTMQQDTALDKMNEEVQQTLDIQLEIGDAVSKLQFHIKELDETKNANKAASAENQTQRMSFGKKPELQLTEFSGDSLRWEEFWDDFTCSVDARKDISAIDKFKLLKTALRGEALSVADGYFLTQKNYDEVKGALKDRFGDPQVAIFAHFEALLELKPATHDVAELICIRDKCEAHIRSLSAQGLSEDVFGLVFAPILLSKLPRYVKMELHRRNGSSKWTLSSLREHLKEEIRARTKCDRSYGATSGENSLGKTERRGGRNKVKKECVTVSALIVQNGNKTKTDKSANPRKTTTDKKNNCVFCSGEHCNYDCKKYSTADDRVAHIKGRCYMCLSGSHQKSACTSTKKCYYCGKNNHNSALCYKEFGRSKKEQTHMVQNLNPEAMEFIPTQKSYSIQESKFGKGSEGIAILESAFVTVSGEKEAKRARIVFDNGSTLTLIRQGLASEIGARRLPGSGTALSRVGDSKATYGKYPKVELQIHFSDGTKFDIKAREIPNVATPMKLVPINKLELERLAPEININEIAELLVDQPTEAPIDILLGLNYYYELVEAEIARLPNGLVIKDTRLGKIMTGYLTTNDVQSISSGHHLFVGEEIKSGIDQTDLEQFWNLERIGISDDLESPDNEVALARFNDTVKIEHGRYQVQWPFHSDNPQIPDNYDLALNRLKTVHRKLQKDTELLATYNKTFQDQLRLGVIEEAPENPQGIVHYLPHHAVITPQKTTTKVRVVFDASAKPSKMYDSLNESMYRGPVFLNDLCGMILRFGLSKVAIVSDVEKAFLQISLQKRTSRLYKVYLVKRSNQTGCQR